MLLFAPQPGPRSCKQLLLLELPLPHREPVLPFPESHLQVTHSTFLTYPSSFSKIFTAISLSSGTRRQLRLQDDSEETEDAGDVVEVESSSIQAPQGWKRQSPLLLFFSQISISLFLSGEATLCFLRKFNSSVRFLSIWTLSIGCDIHW